MKKVLSIFAVAVITIAMVVSTSAMVKADGTTPSAAEGTVTIMAAQTESGSAPDQAVSSTDKVSAAADTNNTATDNGEEKVYKTTDVKVAAGEDAQLYTTGVPEVDASQSSNSALPYIIGTVAVIVLLGGFIVIRAYKKSKN